MKHAGENFKFLDPFVSLAYININRQNPVWSHTTNRRKYTNKIHFCVIKKQHSILFDFEIKIIRLSVVGLSDILRRGAKIRLYRQFH